MRTARGTFARLLLTALERGLVGDALLRAGIRRLLAARLEQCREDSASGREQRFIDGLGDSPLALETDTANEQHYEVPTEFFEKVLGRHMKYSCAYWDHQCSHLDEAELAMLELTCERAELADGQKILELGCGWGSLTLFMAERFPAARITAVSNSATQKRHIDREATRRGLGSIEVLTVDINDFTTADSFDRVVSIEMFEHMRNYAVLFERIESWLRPAGKLFVHVFCHRRYTYPFEVRNESDWMARYFFTGGLMPSASLLPSFGLEMRLEDSWLENGAHYEKTANAWLANMDARREEIVPIVGATYGVDQQTRWWTYWRVFFMACAELFAYQDGGEWGVAHYRFAKPSHPTGARAAFPGGDGG